MDESGTPRVVVSTVTSDEEPGMVRELLREYAAWVVTLESDAVNDPPLKGIHEEIEALPGVYAPPLGRILLARLDGQPAGCVCLRPFVGESGEVKRLYVRPKHRGAGIGRALVEALLTEARACGYAHVVLDSHVSMSSAHAVYEAAGFRTRGPLEGFPLDLVPVAVFMERDLKRG